MSVIHSKRKFANDKKFNVNFNNLKACYEVRKNDQAEIKSISYQYAFIKAQRLHLWLQQRSIFMSAPKEENVGMINGYKEFRSFIDTVEDYCQIRGIKCDAMLHSQLVGLEGKKVRLEYHDGRTMDRWIGVAGKYILYHIHKANQEDYRGGLCFFAYRNVSLIT